MGLQALLLLCTKSVLHKLKLFPTPQVSCGGRKRNRVFLIPLLVHPDLSTVLKAAGRRPWNAPCERGQFVATSIPPVLLFLKSLILRLRGHSVPKSLETFATNPTVDVSGLLRVLKRPLTACASPAMRPIKFLCQRKMCVFVHPLMAAMVAGLMNLGTTFNNLELLLEANTREVVPLVQACVLRSPSHTVTIMGLRVMIHTLLKASLDVHQSPVHHAHHSVIQMLLRNTRILLETNGLSLVAPSLPVVKKAFSRPSWLVDQWRPLSLYIQILRIMMEVSIIMLPAAWLVAMR